MPVLFSGPAGTHIPTPALARSLGANVLCDLGYIRGNIYTTEGITKLFEGLKGSAITSLECATAP